MEQDASAREGIPDGERSGPSRAAPRPRSSRQRQLAAGRMADAARAAHDGFHGPGGAAPSSAKDAGRVRAVDLLFDPAPVPARPASSPPGAPDPSPATDPPATTEEGPEAGGPDAPDGREVLEVWNPFRRTRSGAATPTGPTLDDLHVRRTSVRCTAIATVRESDATGHGTGTGDPTPDGTLRAVADATIAARRVLTGERPPMVVVRVEPSVDGREVAVTLAASEAPDPGGPARVVGRATLAAGTDDPAWATAIATLRALTPEPERAP